MTLYAIWRRQHALVAKCECGCLYVQHTAMDWSAFVIRESDCGGCPCAKFRKAKHGGDGARLISGKGER